MEGNGYESNSPLDRWKRAFGSRLYHLIERENLSLYQFAKRAHISPSALYSYVDGKVNIPLYRAMQIAKTLGISVDELVNGGSHEAK